MSENKARGPMMGGHRSRAMNSGEKAKDFKGAMKRLFQYMERYKFRFILMFIFAIAGTIFNIVGPKILGNSTGVSSFGVLFSILLFGGLFGFVGMIIAVPLMAVIIHVYRQIQDHFLAKKNLSREESDYVKLDRIDERSGEYIKSADKE